VGLLQSDPPRARAAAALADCARRPQAPSRFDVTRVVAAGCADHFLVAAPPSETAELDHKCALASSRWELTSRQREVLRELASGATNRVIAATLGTSERTIEVHVAAIFDKAAVSSRAELIAALWARSS
jgi:DNA-binding NarL/FixJ family response regulator